MLKYEAINNKSCPKCKSKEIAIKITKNSQYVICKNCLKIRSHFQWFY